MGSGPNTARATLDGGAAMDGGARASHSWAGPTAAQLICTDQAWLLGERLLSHKRKVLTLHALLSLQAVLPQAPEQAAHGGRLPQTTRPQAQLPCQGVVHSRQAPNLAWPHSHGPQGGGGLFPLQPEGTGCRNNSPHSPPDSSPGPAASRMCSRGWRSRVEGRQHMSTHSLWLRSPPRARTQALGR